MILDTSFAQSQKLIKILTLYNVDLEMIKLVL